MSDQARAEAEAWAADCDWFIETKRTRAIAVAAHIAGRAAGRAESQPILKELEWAWFDDDQWRCMVCHHAKRYGHTDNCRLARFLDAAPGQETK
jgi:hypothetical protein